MSVLRPDSGDCEWNTHYQMKNRITGTIKSVTVAAALLFAAAISAHATTIVVTNTNDSGSGSLRNALSIANDGDTIDATGVSGTILLTSGELQVTHNVTINGPGAATLAVNGNAVSRVFENFAGIVTISELTITNGVADGNGGGAILNHGGLTLRNSIISNSASLVGNNNGGGLNNSSGAARGDTNSTIRGNSSCSNGRRRMNGRGTGGATNRNSGHKAAH